MRKMGMQVPLIESSYSHPDEKECAHTPVLNMLVHFSYIDAINLERNM